MLTDNKLLRIKNGVLLLLAVICPIVCRLISIPLPSVMTEWDKTSLYIRNMTGYLRDNYISLVFFVVFLTSGLTSLLLGNLIHRKFDRNKEASVISLRAGLFFLIAAAFFLTDANTMFVLPSSRELSGYISCASLMLMPQLFIACVKLVYKRKWIILSEWIFLILEAAFFVLGMLQAPQEYVTLTVRILGFLFCFFVMACAVMHIKTLSGKQTDGKHLFTVLCIIQIVLIISGLVFYILQHRKIFMLCCGLALSIYAYIVFSEMLNIAARRYIKTSDYESVRKMAYIDSLCNISNRNAFILEQEASFDCDELCYIVFDLNNLKRINDKYGHAEGDKMIKKAAEIISLSFEEFGKCFRIGGDEFAVIGRYKTLAQIEKELRKFKNHIKEYNSKSNLKLDLAYGYARRENTDISTYELFNKADKEMYRFKRRGKAFIKLNA